MNKTACLFFLEQFPTCISEANNALRLVKNYKHRMTSEEKAVVSGMEVRLLLRKGASLLKQNK